MVTEEKKYNASIDRMCSRCGDYATEIDWEFKRYKLCDKCFKKYIKGFENTLDDEKIDKNILIKELDKTWNKINSYKMDRHPRYIPKIQKEKIEK